MMASTAIPGGEDRNIVPRWRPLLDAAAQGELSSEARTAERAKGGLSSLIDAEQAFTSSPGIATAGDLLSQIVVTQQPSKVIAEAIGLIEGAPNASASLRNLVAHVRHPASDVANNGSSLSSWGALVAVKRRAVRAYPRNAIAWVELALAHVNLGQIDSGERELRIARRLAPVNRYVIRSSARFAALTGDLSEIRKHMRSNAEVFLDPWILASELALAEIAERPSPQFIQARNTVRRKEFDPWHISELASAVGTNELRSGSDRRAKETLAVALTSPTENALAQVEWARSQGLALSMVDEALMKQPLSHEANASRLATEGHFAKALEHALLWHKDQPFAPEPAGFVSWVASVGVGDFNAAAQAARQGLVASPNDPMLANNLVFALTSMGLLDDAERRLNEISPDFANLDQLATLTATRGFLAFKRNDFLKGRGQYQAAIRQFESNKRRDLATLAALLWVREELSFQTGEAEGLARTVLDASKGVKDSLIQMWRKRLSNLLADQA